MPFQVDDKQAKKLKAWIEKKKKPYAGGAIGGRYTYCFTPTSLGMVVKVQDSVDKDEIDLTDYHEW